MAVLPSVLKPCVEDAATRAGTMIDRATDNALGTIETEMRALPSQVQRQQYAAALREMSMLRGRWRITFPETLRESIQKPPATKAQAGMMRPSSLSLVDDEEVQQNIESSRLAQLLRNATEQPLAELDALMSSAMGIDGIQADANVLRPEIYAHALRGMLAKDAEEAAHSMIWMRHIGPALGGDLAETYRSAVKLLKQARVEAAGYRVVTSPAPLETPRDADRDAQRDSQPAALDPNRTHDRKGGSSQPGGLWRGVAGFTDLISQAIRGPKFSEFLMRGSAQAMQALAPGWFARVDQELAALEARSDEAPLNPQVIHQHAHLPAVDRPMREVGTDSPLDREVWGELGAPRQRSLVRTRLKKQAQNIGQAMGLEVVRQLVDQVAKDPRLLAPVREAIVALEPSLARLALLSPRFFGEADNPARQLVERVAERSFKYNDEFAYPFVEFFRAVSVRFRALNAYDALKDDAPFKQALADLQATWQREDEAEEAQKQKLREAMQFAEARQAEAGQIAWGLGQRSDLEGVPAEVQDFLYGRWALVMAHARLKSSGKEIDPGGFGAVVTDLLWTVKRETVLRDPAHAFGLIPRVLAKLRAGLELLGDMPSEDDAFFKALERLHRPVLKLRAKTRQATFDLPSVLPPDAASEVRRPGRDKDKDKDKGDELWLAPAEQRAYGYQDTELVVNDRPVAPSPHTETQIHSLTVGCWVDLYSRNEWLRAQLTWASANGALFMFVSHGGLAHSMTRRNLQRLLTERLMRLVETHAVVQRAIDQIAQPLPERLAA